MTIPFLDLKAQYAGIQEELEAAVLQALRSTRYVLGPQVEAFEAAFAGFCGAQHAVAVNTGTSALHLALLASGVGPGDEVVTTPHTFVATVAAILYTGATPVLADVDPVSMTLDPEAAAAAVTGRTRAVVPVHLYGQCADMDPILELAKAKGLTVIEDACQAHGAEYKGRRAGSMGDAGCFSFYPGKNLGACGEGGAVTTDDPDLARRLRMLRDWGAEKKYAHELQGYNCRMDAVQGAALGVKLKYLEAWTEARRAVAAVYDEALADVDGLTLPQALADRRHVYHIYAVRTPERDALQAHLGEAGVHTGIHYPQPVHLMPAYADLGYAPGDFPHAEAAAAQELSLPMYAELTPDMARQAADAVRDFFEGGRA